MFSVMSRFSRAAARVAAGLFAAVGRWRRGALEDRDRFVLLAAATVAANAVISYG